MIIKAHKLRVSGASQAGGGEDNQHSPPKSTRPRTIGVGLPIKGHRHAFWMDTKTLTTTRAALHPLSTINTPTYPKPTRSPPTLPCTPPTTPLTPPPSPPPPTFPPP